MADQTQEFDIVIVGGGPGGYVAALRAAQLGKRTALVERESLGGICLNWGCIPTKALLHCADTLRNIRQAGALGITVGEPRVDFEKIIARSRQASRRLNGGVTHLLSKAGVSVFMGTARVPTAGRIQVESSDGNHQTLRAEHTIIAVGARSRELPILPFDGTHVWSYRDALSAKALPKSLIVIGAGAIGLEFASFYATLGTDVTVVEAVDRILPGSDEEISHFVQKTMSKDGIRFLTGAIVQEALVENGCVQLRVQQGDATLSLQAERALVAVGLVGNAQGLGLENTRVQVEDGLVRVGDWGATAEPGIYAIGDVTGAPMLAHKASHEGVACVEHIVGLRTGAQHPVPMPACVYSYPPSASVGLTEAQARQQTSDVRVGKFPLEANGKAVATDAGAGFIKTVFNSHSGELLGAHLVGAEATELVHGYTIAATLETTEAEIIDTVFPHPTISEAMHEAVLAAYGRALHH